MPLPSSERLRELRNVCDKEADDVVTELRQGRDTAFIVGELGRLAGWRVGTAMPGDFSGPMKNFIEGAVAPGGKERERILRAQHQFEANDWATVAILACGSLPACYAQPDVAVALTGSGRLLDQVRLRLGQTVEFVTVVMKPGALGADGDGLLWVRKLRLMHAFMRAFLRERPADHPAPTGNPLVDALLATEPEKLRFAPLNQVDLAFVLLTFSWLVIRGWRSLGITADARARADYVATWAVIGRMIGIREELLTLDPDSLVKDAKSMFNCLQADQEEGTESGRLLAAALGVIVSEIQRQTLREIILSKQTSPLFRTIAERVLAFFPVFVDNCVICMARTLIRKLAGRGTASRLWVGRAPFLYWIIGAVALQYARFEAWRAPAPAPGLAQAQALDTIQPPPAAPAAQPGVYPAIGAQLRAFIRDGATRHAPPTPSQP